MKITHDVIIIGGGTAGLTAASVLGEQGASVLVLEARPRLGGRIHTLQTPDHLAVDIGASLLQSPLLKRTFSLQTKPVNIRNALFYDNQGKAHTETEFTQLHSIQEEFARITAKVTKAKQTFQQNPLFPTLATVLQLKTVNPMVQHYLTAVVTHNTGLVPDQVSLLELLMEPENSKMATPETIQGGAQKLINALKEKCDKTKKVTLVINMPIHAVQHEERANHNIVIAHNGQQYVAKAVLCTVPLGVLKHGEISFTPSLSRAKQHAIEHLKIGQQNKIVLVFEKPFWPPDIEYLTTFDSPFHLMPEYQNLNQLSGFPALLCTVYATDAQFKNTPDKTIIDKALEPLRHIFKHQVSPLKFAAVSRWDSDPYALGKSTVCGPNTSRADLNSMRTVERGGLYFAGEHTSPTQHGTIEGAFEEGLLKGLEISAFLKYRNQNQPYSGVAKSTKTKVVLEETASPPKPRVKRK